MMKRFKTFACVFLLAMTMMLCGCGKKSNEIPARISDEQAIEAIRNYCCKNNPDLESIIAEEYPVYWEITSSDNNEIVVLFRSYTGAQERYYIDRASGTAVIAEFVPGITNEEEPTGESINIRDYLN